MSDDRSVALLLGLADLSVRWGLLIGLLAVAFAIRPPRLAATRHAICVVALAAGPLLAIAPRWVEVVVPRPASPAVAPDPTRSPTPALDPPPFALAEPRPAVVPAPRVEPAPPEASIAAPRPSDRSELLARALVGVWLSGALTMLARLGLGAWTLARWNRSAIAPTDEDLAMLTACLAEVPVRRGVRLARHAAVASPVMIGGLRPTILVPVGWVDWPAALRRAALRHELAHVRRGDDAFKLAEELIRCPFWFHPLVAWLLGRLDRERELLCDEAAVAQGGDPKGLARLLLELGRPGPSRRAPSASLPFLGRRTTAIRIERLLEDDMSRTLSRPSFARTWLLGPLALAVALGLGGLRVRPAAAQEEPTPASVEPKALRGLVVDPDGKPLAGAAVTIEDPRADAGAAPTRWSLASGADGRFSWTPPPGLGRVRISVAMPGLAPRTMPLDPAWVAESARELRIALGKIGTLGGVLVDERGRPLAGARVRATLELSRMPGEGGAPAGGEAGHADVNFTISNVVDPASDLGAPKETVTAADGSFSLPGDIPSAVYEVKFEVHAVNGARLSVRPAVPAPANSTPTTFINTGYHLLAPGERPRLTAVPSAWIEGRVESEIPGLDLSTLTVRADFSVVNPQPEARIDRQGRFALDAVDDWPVQVVLAGPGVNASWTFSPVRVDPPVPGSIVPVTIRVVPGVEVRGRVVERGSDRPGEGVWLDVWSSAAPIGGPLRIKVDTDGRYAVRLLPGEATIAVCHPGERCVGLQADPKAPFTRRASVLLPTPRAGEVAKKASSPGPDPFVSPIPTASAAQFTIPTGAATFDAPPIQVAPAVTLRGRLLAADGTPIAGATLSTHSDRPYITAPLMIDAVMTRTDDRGGFRFRPGAGTVEAGHEATLLVVRPGRKPQEVRVAPDAEGVVEVVLPEDAVAPSDAIRGELNGLILQPAADPAGR